jgi:hypothetical protein
MVEDRDKNLPYSDGGREGGRDINLPYPKGKMEGRKSTTSGWWKR